MTLSLRRVCSCCPLNRFSPRIQLSDFNSGLVFLSRMPRKGDFSRMLFSDERLLLRTSQRSGSDFSLCPCILHYASLSFLTLDSWGHFLFLCVSDATLQHSVMNRVEGKSPSNKAARSSRSDSRCAFREDVTESGEMWILSSGGKTPCFQEMQYTEFARSRHRSFTNSTRFVKEC